MSGSFHIWLFIINFLFSQNQLVIPLFYGMLYTLREMLFFHRSADLTLEVLIFDCLFNTISFSVKACSLVSPREVVSKAGVGPATSSFPSNLHSNHHNSLLQIPTKLRSRTQLRGRRTMPSIMLSTDRITTNSRHNNLSLHSHNNNRLLNNPVCLYLFDNLM